MSEPFPLVSCLRLSINALANADYSQRGAAPIQIAFFDNCIEIENPEILLPGMTVNGKKQVGVGHKVRHYTETENML